MQSESDRSESPPRIDSAAASRLFKSLLTDPEQMPESSQPEIKGYRIEAHAGTGGQGTTWIARKEPGDGTRVAIKILRYSERGFPREYWSELEALANLRLRCLPRMIDSGITDGHPWIASEMIEGSDLVSFERAASLDELIETIARAAEALDRLHSAGFAHRDIKPSNLMVRGSDGAVFLVDFGLACRLGGQASTRHLVGTPVFMSPEQARGEPATAASDQWSLAATAFLMLTRETPHMVAGTREAQLELARTGTPRAALAVAPSLAKSTATVLDRALSTDPLRRFADCAEFARAIRDTAPHHARSTHRRWRSAVALSIALATATTAALLFVRSPAEHGEIIAIGTSVDGGFGEHISVIGDLDGDGLDEVAVAAPIAPAHLETGWRVLAGEVFILNGRRIAGVEHSSPHVLRGPRAHARFGRYLYTPGDVDGDRIPDLVSPLLGTDGAAVSFFVVKGSTAFASPGETDVASHPTVLQPADLGQGPLGTTTGCDLDGDGFSDIVACEANREPERAGGLLILRGAKDFFTTPVTPQRVAPPPGVRSFGSTIALAQSLDGSQPLLLVGAALGSQKSAMRGQIVVMRRDLGILGALVGGRSDEWFGHSINGCIDGGVLRIACGALGIARSIDDSGSAYLAEIPIGAFAGRSTAIDLDSVEAKPWIRSRIVGKTSTTGGSGELCGQSVALLPDGWVVSAPRAEAGYEGAGRVWIESNGVRRAIQGESRLEECGRSVAVWQGKGRTVVLIGAPVASVAGRRACGVVRAVEVHPSNPSARGP